jgi:hypothetical protein
MITIFGVFRQFSAKKLAFFSKTNVMITFFIPNLALFVKNAKFFAHFFGENILFNHNIDPWMALTLCVPEKSEICFVSFRRKKLIEESFI